MIRKIVCFMLFYCLAIIGYPKYHPEIRWQQVKEGNFQVIFPFGYEEEALYTLELAGDMYRRLEQIWGNRIEGTIRILLTDVQDDANGNATFFPFNLIEIYLFNPTPDSALGSYREWIPHVLSHEMSHLFNMNDGSKFTFFMRRIFGNNPVFFPVIIAPVWLIEGWAIYGESLLNDFGRLNTPEFDIFLSHIAGARKVPRWPYIFGDSTAWPGASTPYLYGSKFIQYLERLYGPEKVNGLLDQYSYYFVPITFKKNLHLVPLTIRNRFKRVFQRDLHDLWREFVASIDVREAGWGKWDNPQRLIDRLTSDGMYKQFPVFIDREDILFFHRDYRQFPGLYRLNIRTGERELVLKKAEVGCLFFDSPEKTVYFSAANYYKNFYRYSDLYRFNLHTGKLQRLSKGSRLSYPVKFAETIFCVKREKTQSFLAVLHPEGGDARILSRGFDGLAFMSVSPDGERIAVSLKQRRRNWAIGLFDRKGNLLRTIGDGERKCYYPKWKNQREVFFVSEYQRQYRLMSFDIESGVETVYLEDNLPSINYFDFQPGGGAIVGSFYDANGFNLGIVDPGGLTSVSIKRQAIPQEPSPATRKPGGRDIESYRPFPDLWPKYFSPLFRFGGNELQPGVYFTGNDSVGRHYVSLEAYYGVQSRSANVAFDYIFDGFLPTLHLRYSNLTDLDTSANLGDFSQENRQLSLSSIFPLHTSIERQFRIYGDIHFEYYRDRYTETGEVFEGEYNGLRLGLVHNSSRRYYDSLSLNDGSWLSLSYSNELKLLGSDANIQSASLEFKRYASFFRPDVLAFRLVAADSWGDVRRIYYMGGATSQADNTMGGNQLFKLMRGYPSGYFVGTGGILLNVEYRIALVKIEKVFLIFRSFERIYLTLFSDIGNVWGIGENSGKRIDPSYSFGVEMNLIAYIGRDKYNISAGIAAGHKPDHKPVFYIRLGNSF